MTPPDAVTLASTPRLPSLRSRLLRSVVLPLGLTWALGMAATVGLANHFVQRAFDRALVDDAFSLASHVRGEGAQMMLMLSQPEISHVLFDQSESVYFAIQRPDGSLVAGHPGLGHGASSAGEAITLDDISFQGKALRSVTLRQPNGAAFILVMAQTRLSRDHLLQQLLVYSIIPQVLLLLVLGLWLRRSIEEQLAPLAQLQDGMSRRAAHDLNPVPTDASTRDLHRLSQALNGLLARIRDSVQAQREFTGNVAHELRTPLARIRAQAEYGLAQPDPRQWREQLEGILASEIRAAHLVDQLLALALADEAALGQKLEPVALDRLVTQAVMRFLPQADALGVDLGARGIDQTVWVQANATLIDGILGNLIDNALRHGAPQQPHAAHVTVAVSEEADRIRLCVIDNGPGIEEGLRQQVTQRWVRGVSGPASRAGSGLGLAIVGQYAAGMGGSWSLSTPADGVGLQVCITLPRAMEPVAG